MVFVEMYGRMGNQLFRYAFARKIMTQSGDSELILSFNEVKERQDWDKVNYLEDFKIISYKEYEKKGKILLNETVGKECRAN